MKPNIKISYVDTPKGEDVNSLSQSHEAEIFTHLLDNRIPVLNEAEGEITTQQDLFFSLGNSTERVLHEKRKVADNGRFVKQSTFNKHFDLEL